MAFLYFLIFAAPACYCGTYLGEIGYELFEKDQNVLGVICLLFALKMFYVSFLLTRMFVLGEKRPDPEV